MIQHLTYPCPFVCDLFAEGTFSEKVFPLSIGKIQNLHKHPVSLLIGWVPFS